MTLIRSTRPPAAWNRALVRTGAIVVAVKAFIRAENGASSTVG